LNSVCSGIQSETEKFFVVEDNRVVVFSSNINFDSTPTYETEYNFTPTNDPVDKNQRRGQCNVAGDNVVILHNSIHILKGGVVSEYSLPTPFDTPSKDLTFDLSVYVPSEDLLLVGSSDSVKLIVLMQVSSKF
jgi:hypothetical protein